MLPACLPAVILLIPAKPGKIVGKFMQVLCEGLSVGRNQWTDLVSRSDSEHGVTPDLSEGSSLPCSPCVWAAGSGSRAVRLAPNSHRLAVCTPAREQHWDTKLLPFL